MTEPAPYFTPVHFAAILDDAADLDLDGQVPDHIARGWIALERSAPDLAARLEADRDDEFRTALNAAKLAAVTATMLKPADDRT